MSKERLTMSNTTDSFKVYQFAVRINLSRQTDRYTSDSLGKVDITREIPLANDAIANARLHEIVSEELERTFNIVEARIDFENTVKQLTGGDVIEARIDFENTVEQLKGGDVIDQ